MITRLGVAHRLLLIYLLSLASVAVLVFTLVDEKSVAIEFAEREKQGSAYVRALRDALVAVAGRWGDALEGSAPAAAADNLDRQAEAIRRAEAELGAGFGTATMSVASAAAVRAAGAAPVEPGSATAYGNALAQLRRHIAHVADQSNLVLDPDLDSYYAMSIAVLRLPEIVGSMARLADSASAILRGQGQPDLRMRFLLADGDFIAALQSLDDDVAASYRGDRDGALRGNLDPAYRTARRAFQDYMAVLRDIALLNRTGATEVARAAGLRREALGAATALWQRAAAELDRLLDRRVERVRNRLLADLGVAGLVSLVVLVLTFYVARHISRPIRELADVAERMRTGQDYGLRAKSASGGELGVLVRGFNAMLDRLQAEAAREKELAARERAAAAQRELLETMPAWLAVLRRADGEILYANRAVGLLPEGADTGAGEAEIVDRLHGADRQILLTYLSNSGRLDGFEARLVLPGDALVWVLIQARPLTYAAQACALVVFTPIDALKRAEMEREKLSRRLVDAIESLGDGFALYDDADCLIVCNEPYRRINETVRDRLVPGARWIDLVRAGLERGQFAEAAGREAEWLADRLRDRANPGKAVDVKLASGRWLRAVDQRTREGGLVSIRADVTEEKVGAERLRTSEAFKSAIINSALDSIITIDEAGHILEFNPAAERAFGRSRDDVLGQPLDGLVMPERLRAAHRDGLSRYLESGASRIIGRRLEVDAQRADGTEFPIEIAVSEVALDGRRAFTAYLRDITGRRAAEAELARRASLLEAVGYTASEIVAGVDWQRGIRDLLARLGGAAAVSRVTLFEAHVGLDGRLVQSCRYDWAEDGLQPLSGDPRYQDMPLTGDAGEEIGEWTLRRQRGEIIQAVRSETSGYTREVFEEHGTLSFLSVPIMVRNEWWGFLGFDDCKTERVWTDVEIDVLKTSAALIAGAIERARAEERLRLSEQRYALAARGANDGLWDWDVAGDTAYFSPRLHEILGLADGQLGTSPSALFDRVSEADLPELQQGLETRFARRGRKFEFECRMRHQAAAERWMMWRGMIVYGADGPTRIVGSLHDITERKEAEAKLRESEARFRALADDAPVLLDLLDSENRLVFANRRYLEFLGRSLDEVTGDGWKSAIHPDDLPQLTAFANRAPDGRGGAEIEYRARRHDGEYRWIHLTEAIRRGPDGRFAGFVDALVDVTDRKRAEAEVARQREALHQSEKLTALGSLLAGVAHELNNPLSVVVGQALLLEETARDPKVVGRSETIRRAAERCSRIVRTFLTMARRRAPEQSLVNLNATVEMAIELLAYQLRISDIELKLDLAPDLPDLLADGDQLHQVVTNLIVNAEQALGDSPRPRRLVLTTRADPSRRMVSLTVADNGPGIDPEIRTRIFEPFFTTKPLGQGTGIGLAMCRNVVAAHHGTISVAETPGGGASFTVELPLPTAAARPAPMRLPAGPAAAARPRHRILVVDDEAEIAQTLAEILTSAGHEVAVAGNGRQALDHLAVEPCDIILSDLRMPVLDGPALFAALGERHPQMIHRIAFITGDTLSARLGKFLADTGVLCLEKPFTPEDVRQLIAEVLQQPIPSA